MSVSIDKKTCVGCKKCVEVCPGNLIQIEDDGRAGLKFPEDCWGCTSCLKECQAGAILFFLGADIGGRGSTLSYHEKNQIATWTVTSPDGEKRQIVVDKTQSNKY